MKKWFLRVCFVVFLFVSSIFLIGVNVLHSLFDIELLEKLSSNQLIVLFLVVTVIVFIITFMAASIVFFLQRLTDSVMYNQLEAIRNQQYSNVKKSVDEIWYRPLLMIRLDTFFQETAKIAEMQEQLVQNLQQISSRPEYIGEETKEEIIELERHRIARELHDSVSQQLFAAMMMLSAMNEQKEQLSPVIQQQLALVEKVINDSQSEMRALLLHLRPISLENKTLVQGIESLLKELTTKVQLSLHWELDEVTLPSTFEDHLFRIVQELVSNTLRHAKAKQLEVFLKQKDDYIILKLVDDGIGFDTSVSKSGSYGLKNIEERVAGMGGQCKIISIANQGTIIEIKIPQKQEKE